MKTQKALFAGCSIVALGLTALIIGLLWITEREANRTGLGGEVDYVPVIIVGSIVVLFFALLSWRNDIGLREQKRYQEQIKALQRGYCYNELPTEDDVIINKARQLWRAGKPHEAITLLEVLPDNPLARRMLEQAKQKLATHSGVRRQRDG